MRVNTAPFDTQLLSQLKNNTDYEGLKSIIENGMLYHTVDISNNTLLHYAAKWDNEYITLYLTMSGSHVDAKNDEDQTPIMLAIAQNNWAIVYHLLEAGADIYQQNNRGESGLKMFRCSDYSDSVAQMFFQKIQHDFDGKDDEIANLLVEAEWPMVLVVGLRNKNVTELVLQREKSSSIATCDVLGRTALQIAAKALDVENVKFLLDRVVDDNVLNSLQFIYEADDITESNTYKTCKVIITESTLNDRFELLKIFLERQNLASYFPLNFKILCSINAKEMQLLLDHELDLFIVGDYKNTPVHNLAKNLNPGVIEKLRGKNYDINARNRHGWTPLMCAASYGNPSAVEFLLQEGADIEARDENNSTALIESMNIFQSGSEERSKECLQILLEYGANCQMHDDDKTVFDTALEKSSWATDLMSAHLALQKARGKVIVPRVLSQINSRKKLKNKFESSQRELKVKIHRSTTLLDILNQSESQLERRVRNKEFFSRLNIYCEKTCKFYYFKTLLQKRKCKAIQMVKLKRQAAYVVSRMMEMEYERFPLIADDIVSYLDQRDMETLISVFD